MVVNKAERELTISLYALRVGLHHLFKAKGDIIAKMIVDALENVLKATNVPFTPKETSPWLDELSRAARRKAEAARQKAQVAQNKEEEEEALKEEALKKEQEEEPKTAKKRVVQNRIDAELEDPENGSPDHARIIHTNVDHPSCLPVESPPVGERSGVETDRVDPPLYATGGGSLDVEPTVEPTATAPSSNQERSFDPTNELPNNELPISGINIGDPPSPLSVLFNMIPDEMESDQLKKETQRKKTKKKEKKENQGNIFDNLLKDIEKIVRAAGPDGITQLKFGTIFPMRAKHRFDILEYLVKAKVLYLFHGKRMDKNKSSLGRKTRYYVHKDFVASGRKKR